MDKDPDTATLAGEQKKFMSVDYATLKERDFLTDTYRTNKKVVNFMVYTAARAHRTPYYHPAFPEPLSRTLADALDAMSGCVHVVCDVGDFFPALKETARTARSTDAEFVEAQADGDNVYRFLCFTVHFNNVFIHPRTLDDHPVYRITSIDDEEKTEDDDDTIVVFHGTATDRLYSLIRNGAKTLEKFRVGRVHGHGFYCSPNFYVANIYSDGYVCVFRLRHASRYRTKDDPNIYVVRDTDDMTLTYVVKNTTSLGVLESVKRESESRTTTMAKRRRRQDAHEPPPRAVTGTNIMRDRRVMAETKRATEAFADPSEHGIRVEPSEHSITTWTVYFSDISPESSLAGDMRAAGFREIVLSVEFPEDYPILPPFIRVVYPRFRSHTGHVTYGGSICTELLTSSDGDRSWRPLLAMSVVLIQMKSLLSENGRLDERYLGGEERITAPERLSYSREQAVESFFVALKRHGWKL